MGVQVFLHQMTAFIYVMLDDLHSSRTQCSSLVIRFNQFLHSFLIDKILHALIMKDYAYKAYVCIVPIKVENEKHWCMLAKTCVTYNVINIFE